MPTVAEVRSETDAPVTRVPTQISHEATIIIAGCLGMACSQITLSPIGIEFARQHGGSGLHIGILGAIPTGMLFLQFVSALIANRLIYRRPLWMVLSLCQRLILLPVALGPFLFPQFSANVWLWSFIVLSCANHAMMHLATPLWMSWMGDYLPKEGLSRFWGIRQRWMQWSGAAALLVSALMMQSVNSDIRFPFAVLMTLAAVLGVADILLFRHVQEPPVTRAAETRLAKLLTEPFRNREFRSFISFMCFWHFAAMVGAPFISLYLLSYAGMSLSQVMLLWMFTWIGGALTARGMGRAADAWGHRPILVICTMLKSINMIALILLPADSTIAFWILVPVFLVDSVLNVGFVIATNGFLLTKSPAGNRTMYIAAGTALAGLVGGLTSIAAGIALVVLPTEPSVVAGLTLSGCQILFAVSTLLRLGSIFFVVRIHEPQSHSSVHVISQLVGVNALRVLRFPIGLYRRYAD